MARSTLGELIGELRVMADAGTADYTSAGTVFWTDDQLQTVLDHNRTDVFGEELAFVREQVAPGTVEYHSYFSEHQWWEQTDGGSAIFVLRDGLGNAAGTADWSADYLNGKVTFAADTAGTVYYLTGRSFDLYSAAAEVWRKKASQYATKAIDWKTDNMSITRSQALDQARNMAEYYEMMAGPKTLTMYRGDM